MANHVIPSLAFHHIGVHVKDFAREKEFFVNGLGLKPFTSWHNGEREIQLLEMGNGGMIELFSHGSEEPTVAGRFIHFAMQVEMWRLHLTRRLLPEHPVCGRWPR